MLGTNPTIGSTSRLICTSRSALNRILGISTPLMTTVAIAMNPATALKRGWASRGVTPSTTP